MTWAEEQLAPTILVTDQGNWLHDTRHPSLFWRRTGLLEWSWDGIWLLHPQNLPFRHCSPYTWN